MVLPKSYGPVTTDQIMTRNDDEHVQGLHSETEFADAIIIARNKDKRRKLIVKITLVMMAVCLLIGVGVGMGKASVSKQKGGSSASSVGGGAPQNNDNSSQDPDTQQRTFLTPPPDDLSDICSPTAVSSKQGFAKCEHTCAEAACCNSPGEKLSCFDTNEKTCATYDAFCEILKFDHNGDGKVEAQENVTVPEPPSNLESLCEWDALLNKDGYDKCKNACDPGKCCYEDIKTCKISNRAMCKAYGPCRILHVHEVLTVPAADPNIKNLCAPDSMSKTSGYMSCKNACEPGTCCFEPMLACKVDNPDVCTQYDACSVLSESVTPESHPDAVESQVKTLCTTSNLKSSQGVDECTEACNPGLCCIGGIFGKGDTCNFPDYADWCSQYDACKLLHRVDADGFDRPKDAKKAIRNECIEFSTADIADCKKVCSPAECCFKIDEDCGESGMANIKCDHYEACGHLYANDQDPMTSSIPNKHKSDSYEDSLTDKAEAVVQTCMPDRLQYEDGKQDCLDICEDKLCCFADEGENNCIKTYKEVCIVYAGCEPLKNFYP